MTAIAEPATPSATRTGMTAGLLRELLAGLPSDTEVHLGIYDGHHFGSVHGTLPVTGARISPTPDGRQVLLRVPGLS